MYFYKVTLNWKKKKKTGSGCSGFSFAICTMETQKEVQIQRDEY